MNTFFGKNLRQPAKFLRRERQKLERRLKHVATGGFFKKPFFYFGFFSAILLMLLFTASPGLATLGSADAGDVIPHSFLNGGAEESPFVSQTRGTAMETPDLKIVGDNAIYAVSTPQVLTSQTLGDMFGSTPDTRSDMVDYTVEIGDTIKSLSEKFGISTGTIAQVNGLSQGASLQEGQSLIIPRVDGLLYIIKTGDTLGEIATKYKSPIDDIVAFNDLQSEGDIFENDPIFLPGAKKPAVAAPLLRTEVVLPNSFFINPTQGVITQGPHGAGRGIDIANARGTPIYAAASGVVKRAQFNRTYGNLILIDHTNGSSAYYGHLESLLVKVGDVVTVGQMIGTMGKTGTAATGYHLHFELRGAKMFLPQTRGAKVEFKL